MNLDEEKSGIESRGGKPQKVNCDFCGMPHYEGKGYYPLRQLSGYGLFCCTPCYEGNWDGWNSMYEPILLAQLNKLGIEPPPRNEKGWLPREF